MLLISSRSSMGRTITPKDLAAIASLMSHFGNFLLDETKVDWPFILFVDPSHLGLKLSLLKEAVLIASLSGDF